MCIQQKYQKQLLYLQGTEELLFPPDTHILPSYQFKTPTTAAKPKEHFFRWSNCCYVLSLVIHTPFHQSLKEAEEIKAGNSHAKTFSTLLKTSHRVCTHKHTQSTVNCLYQTWVQPISNTSRNKWIDLTVTKKGTDKDHWSFNFSSAPWKYFIFLVVHTKKEKRWHLTPQLITRSIPTNTHACLRS